jgi:NADP-dependent 3-hydroxy acid dehydrogenase YdfG
MIVTGASSGIGAAIARRGGAFHSSTATGLMPIAHRITGVRSFP